VAASRTSYFSIVTTSTADPATSAGRGWVVLSRMLTSLLQLTLVGNIATLAFSVWSWRTFSQWLEDPDALRPDDGQLHDSVALVSSLGLSAAHLAVLVVFAVWLYGAHRRGWVSARLFERRSGWTVGWWLALVGACVATRMTSVFMSDHPKTREGAIAALARANLADSVASVLFSVAALLALVMVRTVTRRVEDQVSGGPRRDIVTA